MDRKLGVTTQGMDKLVDRARGECHRHTAAGTNEMMAMAGRSDDIGRVPARLENSGQHIDRGQNLQGAIDRRPSEARVTRSDIGDKLLGRERAISLKYRFCDDAAGLGQPVAVLTEDIDHLDDRWQ